MDMMSFLRIIVLLAILKQTVTTSDVRNFCVWKKVTDFQSHFTFLNQNKTLPHLRLYHIVWSNDNSMVNCAWNDDSVVTANYLDLCSKRDGGFTEPSDSHSQISLMLASCAALNPGAAAQRTKRHTRSAGGSSIGEASAQKLHSDRSEGTTHRRQKRGFIVPGTLWCGSGNKALVYNDLGVFSDTDSCCREHDQCQNTILSFQSNYGVFNTNIFTMSHCDCDNRFRQCLLAAQDQISDVVGYTFFNLLNMNCFHFSYKLQCVKRSWFGMCLEEDMALYAVVHPATEYNYSNTDSDEDDLAAATVNITITSNVTPLILDSQNSRTSDFMFSSTSDPVTHTKAASPAPSASAAASHIPASSSPTLSSSDTGSDSPTISSTSGVDGSSQALTTMDREPVSKPYDQETETMPSLTISMTHIIKANVSNKLVERVTASIDELQSCEVYHDLDKCRLKIPPQQERYGFYNPESRSLYHCNCTRRLFQRLGQQGSLPGLLPVLLEDVYKSCFTLQPQDCIKHSSCRVGLVPSPLPQRSPSGDIEDGSKEVIRPPGRRPSMRKTKMGRPARLYKQCLRMTRSKLLKIKKLHQQGAHSSLS